MAVNKITTAEGGRSGGFVDLNLKNASEVPMCIFLPKGCPAVNVNISGTDVDGTRIIGDGVVENKDDLSQREVRGYLSFHERKPYQHVAKCQDLADGQKLAFKTLTKAGHFFTLSYWEEFPMHPDCDFHKYGYTRVHFPRQAEIKCGNDSAYEFALKYFTKEEQDIELHSINRRERMIRVIITDKFDPTCVSYQSSSQWNSIAWLVDYYVADLYQ